MPDISKCCNNSCPMREICYRFRSKPNEYQSYADFQYKWTPMDEHDSALDYDCDNFWDCRDYDEKSLIPKGTTVEDLFKETRDEPAVYNPHKRSNVERTNE